MKELTAVADPPSKSVHSSQRWHVCRSFSLFAAGCLQSKTVIRCFSAASSTPKGIQGWASETDRQGRDVVVGMDRMGRFLFVIPADAAVGIDTGFRQLFSSTPNSGASGQGDATSVYLVGMTPQAVGAGSHQSRSGEQAPRPASVCSREKLLHGADGKGLSNDRFYTGDRIVAVTPKCRDPVRRCTQSRDCRWMISFACKTHRHRAVGHCQAQNPPRKICSVWCCPTNSRGRWADATAATSHGLSSTSKHRSRFAAHQDRVGSWEVDLGHLAGRIHGTRGHRGGTLG
jgi:hypothetical protein